MSKKKESLSEYVDKKLDEEKTIVKFEDLVLLDGEVFKDLKTDLYPEIKPVYKISNMNRIYSTLSNRLLKPIIKKSGTGYWDIAIQTEYPGCKYSISKSFHMHRLMMVIFNPVKNMKNLFVNHIDGNKQNNDLNNLEWCTPKQNTVHAYAHGLVKINYGEDSPECTISNKIAKKVCDLFMRGEYSKQQIADKLNISKSIVVDITTGSSWKHITKNYDFEKREVFRSSKKFKVDDIHNFCKYFQENKKPDRQSVRQYLIQSVIDTNFKFKTKDKQEPLDENGNKVIDENLIYSLRLIYKKESYNKITSQYTY